jgi:hypothetical protein
MNEIKIDEIMPSYENYQVRIGRKWVYMSRGTLNRIIKGVTVKANIVKKRTRTWIEVEQ